ncbi:hypothetical protein J3R83DRAFT_7166 [Lanmaoa asiatica]|nr:hypothetical protein J3R83DRAFT_7166 [Lanmaoa asiatica]
MTSYVELIRQDFVQSLQSELKLPRWLKSGPVPYTNERVLDLLDHLRVSDDAACVDLWDHTDQIIDKGLQQRLHVAFNSALADCARIRAVVEAENLTETPFPKESFLVILVRNAILDAHTRLSSLQDIPVVLPRHISGETVPILNYMTRSLDAPLIISICVDMPIEESDSDRGHQPSDGEEDSSDKSELFNHSPPTMSEFLDACEGPKTPEEVEEERVEDVLSPRFEAYFLACSPSAAPPSTCHIPVLCMANGEQLPVLMSSLLYQRRVWHIADPLIGVEFSKYDTTIRLFVGWLGSDVSSGRVLPRVHLGEIGTPVTFDLSSPSVALVVSRLMCSLESHMPDIRGTVRHSVGAVMNGTQSHSPLAWRIDTDIQKEDPASILERNNHRDMIIKWAESQQCSVYEETMPSHKQADKISLYVSCVLILSLPCPTFAPCRPGSASSTPPPQQSISMQESDVREPHEYTDSVSTFCSRLSCSAFAATTEKDDNRVFRWMFDRRVVPQSLPSDLDFCEEYSAMTGFIWPETWHVRDDLPSVDTALEPCVQELLASVAAIKTRPNAVKCIPAEESREKKELRENVYEVSWRHDHDRLLFDFFIRLIQPSKGYATHTPIDGPSIAHLEDPLARPTLETTLRLPRSDNLEWDAREEHQESIGELLSRQSTDLRNWVRTHGGTLDTFIKEGVDGAYVLSQWLAWKRETSAETGAQVISKLGQLPTTGRCDALGRLLVELPNISSDDVGHIPLVVRAVGKRGAGGGVEGKASMSKSRARASYRSQGEPSTKTSSSSLTIPEVSSGSATRTNGTRYTILSSSIPSSMQSSDKEQISLPVTTDALVSKAQGLRLDPDATLLELPILAVEYKRASDNIMKGTNQVRMYLTTCVKFLQALGITNVPVYGVQTDGPIVVMPAAIIRDDNFVYLFERLVERLDISTPLGAWHYATILCRLAQHHAKILEKKFEQVRENLITSLLEEGNQAEGWTVDHQMARLKAENRVKLPLREKPRKKRTEAE